MNDIQGYWPKLKGRDASALSGFLFNSPIDVTPYGQAKIDQNLLRANKKKPVEYASESSRNFSMGQKSTSTNAYRKEEVMEYLDAFNSPLCASNTEHRTTYGEFSRFVHKNGRSYFTGGLR